MRGRRANIDLTGKQFYELFVKGPSDIRIRNRPTWDCLCSCGRTCNYTTQELTSGETKSCGHLRGGKNALDLTGRTFNSLTAKYRSFTKNKKVYWHCVCTCGKECDVVTSDLTSGKRKDCGHSHSQYMHTPRTKDITGTIHGYLEVIEMLPSIKTSNKWRAMCRCKCLLCGNIIEIQKDYLTSGDTKSCGCLKSVGEQQILSYLIAHNIPHKTQYRFADLKTNKNGNCWFDFGILNEDKSLKFLIEFQGKQHYEEMPGPWNFGEYARNVTDPLKRGYCNKHNILLYEIKYNDNIEMELDKIFACQSCAKPG